jgi:hypothetical protein
MRDEEFAVVGGAAQKRGILEEVSQPDVAVAAEETAHHAQIVRVCEQWISGAAPRWWRDVRQAGR